MAHLSIWHSADIQIEVRNHAQRYDEFDAMIEKLVKSAKNFDIAVLAGDLTEFATPNEIERKLLLKLVTELAQQVQEVVIIKGNHDIIQQQIRSTFVQNGIKKTAPDALDILYPSFPNNVLLCTESKVYKSKVFDLQYVVWNQKHKYEVDPKLKYNPLENDKIDPSMPAITLFHDCIKNAINFDGKPVRGSGDKPDYMFSTKLILAGDIHCPAIIEKDGQTFTYCSSPIERDFGEGDYYLNGRLIQHGTGKHGYNTIEFDTETNEGKVTFHKLDQYAIFQTLIFDRNFDIETFKQYYEPELCEKVRIKIRIKEDYDRIVNHLEDLLGIIKVRNKDAEIRMETGKDLDGSEVGTNAEIDTDALVSMDKIKEIAAEFITKKVNSSRVISKEDKDPVIKEIVEMLNKELEYFESSSNSLNVVPLHLNLSNFMALGDGISIDFKNGITKLSGSNGTGKSTVFNAIKWMWTDMVYPSQKANYKKENALILFNNKRPEIDTVYGQMVQLVNGDEMTITKTITRNWKKNVELEDKISENWQDYCEMPTVECTVEYQNKTYENEDALNFLSNIFPSMSDITRTLFATAPSLFSIINTTTNELNDEILYNLGLNFFEALADRYDDLRSQIMDKLSKPAYSVGEYSAMIDERNKQIEEVVKPLIEEIKNKIAEQHQTIENLKKKKEELNASLYPVSASMVHVNKEKITEYRKSNSVLDEAIDERNAKIAEARQKYLDQDVANQLPNTESKLKDARSMLDEAIDTQAQYQKELVNISENGSKRQNEILDEVREEVSTIKTAISDKELEKTKLENNKQNLQKEFEHSIEKLDNEYNTAVTKLTHDKEMLLAKNSEMQLLISNLKKRNEQLENGDICPTCGRKHTEESWEYANKEFFDNQSKIQAGESVIASNNAKIEEIDASIKAAKEELKIKKQALIIAKEQGLTDIIVQIQLIDNEIAEYQKKLTDLKQNTKEKIDNDVTIKQLVDQRSATDMKLNKLSADIASKRTVIAQLEQDIKVLKDIEQVYIKDIALWQEQISSYTDKKALQLKLVSELESKNKELESQLEHNDKVNDDIQQKNDQIEYVEGLLKTQTQKEVDAKVQLQSLENENRLDQENITAAIQYRIKDASLRIYKQIIGKNGLSTYIFSMVRPNLNAALNDMLSGLGFVLAFNDNNELKMIKLNDDKQIKQSVAFSSGMESTFLGLSLLYVLKTKNVAKRINILFIDEVTGALNDGSDLSYEASNYQELFKNLLHKMKKQFNIFIIDHVIKNLDEDQRLEVVPTPDGAEIITIA